MAIPNQGLARQHVFFPETNSIIISCLRPRARLISMKSLGRRSQTGYRCNSYIGSAVLIFFALSYFYIRICLNENVIYGRVGETKGIKINKK